MADANNRNTIDYYVNTPGGHSVKWHIPDLLLSEIPFWQLHKYFRTFCRTSNTWWRLYVSIQKRKDRTPLLFVEVKRMDNVIGVAMDAEVSVEFMDSCQSSVFPVQTFTKEGMSPGNEMQETVELVPFPLMSMAFHQLQSVNIKLTVSKCHVEQKKHSKLLYGEKICFYYLWSCFSTAFNMVTEINVFLLYVPLSCTIGETFCVCI